MSLAGCSTLPPVVANHLCVIDSSLLYTPAELKGRERLDGIKGDPTTEQTTKWWAQDRGAYGTLRLDYIDLAKQAAVCVAANAK